MIFYDIPFINNYYKTVQDEKLDITVLNLLTEILNTINNDLSLNVEQEKDNKFKKKYKYKNYNNNYNYNNNNNNNNNNNVAKDYSNLANKNYKNNFTYMNTKKKPPIDKNKLDTLKSSIKTILNKLSPTNYSKLENELLIVYSDILESLNEENMDDIYSIDNYIIEYILYNNISYSSIYVDILFSLINIYYNKDYKLENIYIYNSFKETFEDFLNFEKYIKSSTSGDEFLVNKNNDKYKCFSIFVINFYKKIYNNELEKMYNYVSKLFINSFIIEEFILLLNTFFINNLIIEKNTVYCENILEFLIVIYNDLFKDIRFIKKIDSNLKIHNTIITIIANNNKQPSFTHKIKFKLMDVEDKYKKYIL